MILRVTKKKTVTNLNYFTVVSLQIYNFRVQ